MKTQNKKSEQNVLTDSWDAYKHSVKEIASLNGLFRLNTDNETIIQFSKSTGGSAFNEFDGEKIKGGAGTYEFVQEKVLSISPGNGEKLILVGTEGANRAKSEQNKISVTPVTLFGYGNSLLLNKLSFEDLQAVNGIDTHEINQDCTLLNKAVNGTGIHFHESIYTPNLFSGYVESRRYYSYILSDTIHKTFKYSTYKGTQYVTTSVDLWMPCYISKANTSTFIYIPVVKTKNGYFEVDLSSLTSGLYILQGYSGEFVFEVK